MTMRKNKRKKENIKSFEENAEALPIIQDLRFAIIIHNRTDLAESSIHELLQGCKQYSDMGVFFTYFPKLKIHISTEAVLATEYALTKDTRIFKLMEEQKLFCISKPLEDILYEINYDFIRISEVTADSGCLKFLFANPHKDVIDWAIEHFEELDLDEIEICDTVRTYQSNKELQDYVLNKINLFKE